MPRAFLIKKHYSQCSTTKRKSNVADDDFGVHEPRDYSKKESLASDSGDETCSSPANSPSPQPYSYYQHHHHHHRHSFHPDDIPRPPPAATTLIARATSLDIYGRPTVLEPLNMNAATAAAAASLSNLSGWMKPYLPSYGNAWQHAFPPYGFLPPSVEPFIAPQRSFSPSTPTEEPSAATDAAVAAAGSKCLDLTATNAILRKAATTVNKKLSDDNGAHWTELPLKAVDVYIKKSCPSSGGGGGGGGAAGGRRHRGTTDGSRYNCPDCNKSYSTYSGLSKHQQFHCSTNNKRSFSCKFCEKIYVSLGALKMHIRTHTLPCKCKLCGKAFSRPWLLQGHVRTHTGEKPFTCPHCNRAFADRSNLRAHLQTHSDVKKYSCKMCAKTFSRMSLLLKHEDGGGCATTTAAFSNNLVQERLGP